MNSTKECRRCKRQLPTTEFSPGPRYKDGLKNYCKSCNCELAKINRDANQERAIASTRRWREDPENKARERVTATRYRAKNPEKIRAWSNEWQKRNPEKRRAHKLLYRAIKRGQATRPDCCERCGKRVGAETIEGHHPDHSKPYEVIWVCSLCHSAIAKEERGDIPLRKPPLRPSSVLTSDR